MGWKRVQEPSDGQVVEYRYWVFKKWSEYKGVYLVHGPQGRGFYNEAGTTKMARFRPDEKRLKWRESPA